MGIQYRSAAGTPFEGVALQFSLEHLLELFGVRGQTTACPEHCDATRTGAASAVTALLKTKPVQIRMVASYREIIEGTQLLVAQARYVPNAQFLSIPFRSELIHEAASGLYLERCTTDQVATFISQKRRKLEGLQINHPSVNLPIGSRRFPRRSRFLRLLYAPSMPAGGTKYAAHKKN
jgi:hypothetical protein